MKRYKKFPILLIIFIGLSILGQKYNFNIRGIPLGEHSWAEILKIFPKIIIISSIAALLLNEGLNQIEKKQISDTIKAKRRIEEREKYYSSPNTHECRVCGCYSEDFPWGEDGKTPSYQICPCCGVQFGKEDSTLESIKEYRDKWRSKGGEWFAKNEKPEGWDMDVQMKNIPDGFR